MRLVAKFRPDPAILEAFRASWLVWLTDILFWLTRMLAAHRQTPIAGALLTAVERQLDAKLRIGVRALRKLLLVRAFAQMPTPYRPAFVSGVRPRSVRRHAQRNSFLRKVTSTALKGIHAGSLEARTKRLRDAFDNPAPLIAETLAHMTRLFTAPRLPLVRIAIANDACHATHALTPACADTS